MERWFGKQVRANQKYSEPFGSLFHGIKIQICFCADCDSDFLNKFLTFPLFCQLRSCTHEQIK